MSVDFGDPQRAYSEIHGSTLAAVAGVISRQDEAAKQQDGAAKAEWFPAYTLSGDDSASATVTVATKITMPRWVEYGAAPQAEKTEWDRFYAALEAHEQGHIDLVRQRLSGIDEQLAGQSPDAASLVWLQALRDLQSASDDYDADSDHGRNQGTIIDLSTAAANSD
jgi:predicted secreted Zn-dependent protease